MILIKLLEVILNFLSYIYVGKLLIEIIKIINFIYSFEYRTYPLQNVIKSGTDLGIIFDFLI